MKSTPLRYFGLPLSKETKLLRALQKCRSTCTEIRVVFEPLIPNFKAPSFCENIRCLRILKFYNP